MKTGAEILGVSYGTLYGRYRETFGYLKHAWNSGGRPSRPGGGSSFASLFSSPSMVPSSSVLDAGSLHILEQLKYGKINIRQAAELLKVEPTILAYELAAKVDVSKFAFNSLFSSNCNLINFQAMGGEEGLDHIEMDEEEGDYNEQLVEVQPDVVIHDGLNDDDDLEEEDEIDGNHHQHQHHHHHDGRPDERRGDHPDQQQQPDAVRHHPGHPADNGGRSPPSPHHHDVGRHHPEVHGGQPHLLLDRGPPPPAHNHPEVAGPIKTEDVDPIATN
jgi:hypothetical protein